jgi:Regulator of chromosome condensation (RCC1) repeat
MVVISSLRHGTYRSASFVSLLFCLFIISSCFFVGHFHTVTADVFTFGNDDYGQLGRGEIGVNHYDQYNVNPDATGTWRLSALNTGSASNSSFFFD